MDYPQEKPFSWKHVRLIGILPFDWEHPYIYHYIRYSHLKEMLKNFNGNGSLVLSNPRNWKDPMESRFLSKPFLKKWYGKKFNGEIAEICFTSNSIENSDAFWQRIKTENDDYVVQIKINLYKLLNALEFLADKANGVNFYFSAVNYDYTQTELIENKHLIDWKSGVRQRSISTFIKILSCKRRNFRYENEMRLIMISNEMGFLENGNCVEKFLSKGKEFYRVNIPIKQAISEVIVFDKVDKQKIVNDGVFTPNLIKVSKIYDIPKWKCSKALKQVGF